jgi:8-oxo-dGTP diphosphatase
MVLNQKEDKVLMCLRSRNPYKGLYNLVGGKIEANEDYLSSAYRELLEETGIKREEITLVPFMDFVWHPINMKMLVFIGKLEEEVSLIEEIHKLKWVSLDEDFFDTSIFAGEGNIGHMVHIYKINKDEIFRLKD